MAFVDQELNMGLVGKSASGLAVSQTAAMTLEVATGAITTFQDGVTHTLGAAESQLFVADATLPKQVFVGLIDDGVDVDVWIDEYLDDGFNARGPVPTGFALIQALAWFAIAANETDLINGDLYRRTFV
jgi:hypothetical protein